MTTPQVNISSLDFDEIKESLKSYLADTPEFNSFDFQGSGINLLLNIFAYNTMYYAYYANMIANEMFLETAQLENNFVSLLKPLGVLLPGRSCSVGEITAISPTTTATTLLSYSDYFVGTTTTGLNYRFYTIEDVDMDRDNTTFKVYEAIDVVKDISLNVDIPTQKGYISNSAVDINTIKIKVNGEEWSLYTGSDTPGPDAKVFFIDRTSLGFYVVFGKRTINDFANNYGKNIISTDIVTISYLVPSGEVANNTFKYASNSKASVVSSSNSDGGRLAPDLDSYRYSAPKVFAANDRAITKDDYYGLLLNSNLLPSDITSKEEINIWGGEEANPPAFGRVFISFANEGLTAGNFSVKNSIAFIKRKCPVTVLPEYVQPQIMTANIDINVIGLASTSAINNAKNLVNNYYNTNLKFNNYILISDIKSIILEKYPNSVGINLNTMNLSLDVLGSQTDRNLYFKNELMPAVANSNYQTIKSAGITYNNESVFLGDSPSVFNSDQESLEGYLYLYKTSNNTKLSSAVGRVDYKNGIVTVDPNILPTTQSTPITAKPRYPESVTFTNEILLKVNTTINGA
jgi:hypothetical protein